MSVSPSDTALLTAARGGSHAAFATLVERHRPAVFRLASRLVGDTDEAADIVQETLLRAYRGLAAFPQERTFVRWLLVIARNVAYDALRRRDRSTLNLAPGILASEDAGPEAFVLREENVRTIHAALRALPERYRRPIALRYLYGMRYRDIAATLDLPLGTVKTCICRGKRRLRTELGERRRAA